MKCFYSVPKALLATDPPPGIWCSLATPGVPAVALVIVECWNSHGEQDAWEALPGVVEHHLANWGIIAPAGVITAFAPWGATTGMTLFQVLQLVRVQWPACRL